MESIESKDQLQLAFNSTAAERASLKGEELVPITVDFQTAITNVAGALPKVRALESQIKLDLARFDSKIIDKAEVFLQAAIQSQLDYTSAAAPPLALVELNERGMALRENFMTDAAALAKRGLINPKRLAEYKGATGYRNVAFELMGLANVLRDSWKDIAGKTAVQESELEEANVLGKKLVDAVGDRDLTSGTASAAVDTRMRAFTLLVRTYEEIRLAVGYVRRHEGDLEQIAPSIYAGRRARKSEPSTPAPAPVAPASPGDASHPAAPVAPHAAVGLPDSDPFAKV